MLLNFVLERPWESGLEQAVWGAQGGGEKGFLSRAPIPPWSYNLGQKVLTILHFLTHRTLYCGFGTAMAPPLAHVDPVFLVGIKNEPAGLQHFCFGGKGKYL